MSLLELLICYCLFSAYDRPNRFGTGSTGSGKTGSEPVPRVKIKNRVRTCGSIKNRDLFFQEPDLTGFGFGFFFSVSVPEPVRMATSM